MFLYAILGGTGLVLLLTLLLRRMELKQQATELGALQEKLSGASERTEFLRQQMRRLEENLSTTGFALSEEKKTSSFLRGELAKPVRRHAEALTAGALVLGLAFGVWGGHEWGSVKTELDMRRSYLDLEVAAGIHSQRVDDLTARLADSLRENRETRLQMLREREDKAMALAKLSLLGHATPRYQELLIEDSMAEPLPEIEVSRTDASGPLAGSPEPAPVLQLNVPNI